MHIDRPSLAGYFCLHGPIGDGPGLSRREKAVELSHRAEEARRGTQLSMSLLCANLDYDALNRLLVGVVMGSMERAYVFSPLPREGR